MPVENVQQDVEQALWEQARRRGMSADEAAVYAEAHEVAFRRLTSGEAVVHYADGFCGREVESGDTINVLRRADVTCPACIAALSPPAACCWMGCNALATRVAEREGSQYLYCGEHPSDPAAAGLTFEPLAALSGEESR